METEAVHGKHTCVSETPPKRSPDIDTKLDLQSVEFFLKYLQGGDE